MKNYLLHIAYDGTNFQGFQANKDKRTVYRELEYAIESIIGRETRLIAAGRTDRGVHAEQQLINFLTTTSIPPKGFTHILNQKLPADIICIKTEEVHPTFHSRFAAKIKTYRYELVMNGFLLPTQRNYKALCTYKLDLRKMEEAIEVLKGKHDFSAFSKVHPDRQPVRRIDHFSMVVDEHNITFHVSGESFLHHQVRFMIGAIIDVGRGKITLEELKNALSSKTKSQIAMAAPACGLYLESISYDLNHFKNRSFQS